MKSRKGQMQDLGDFLVAISLILIVAFLFSLHSCSQKEAIEYRVEETKEVIKNEILFLNYLRAPVSCCWPNYKSEFFADEKTTFADSTILLCDKSSGKKQGWILQGISGFYYSKESEDCISGISFSYASRNFFKDTFKDTFRIQVFKNDEEILDYNPHQPTSTLVIEILVPSPNNDLVKIKLTKYLLE